MQLDIDSRSHQGQRSTYSFILCGDMLWPGHLGGYSVPVPHSNNTQSVQQTVNIIKLSEFLWWP